DMTVNVNGIPMFYWPKLTGSDAASNLPVIGVGLDYSEDNGAQVITKWDLFSLTGLGTPSGVSLTVNVDYRGYHGAGVGVDLDDNLQNMHGRLKGYFLPYYTGTDIIDHRQDIGHDVEMRGFFPLQHRQNLTRGWNLSLEVADVSDPT